MGQAFFIFAGAQRQYATEARRFAQARSDSGQAYSSTEWILPPSAPRLSTQEIPAAHSMYSEIQSYQWT